MSGPRGPFTSQSFTIDAKVSNPWKPRLAMSRTAALRFSGVLGTAPQMSAVHPILSFRDCALTSDGNAAAPKPAAMVLAKFRRFILRLSRERRLRRQRHHTEKRSNGEKPDLSLIFWVSCAFSVFPLCLRFSV